MKIIRKLRLAAAFILALSTQSLAAGSQEYRLEDLSKPVTLAAIHRSDNGSSLGMSATLGNSYLKYKAFKGRLELQYVGTFDKMKLPPEQRKTYSYAMEGAAIYRVMNADEYLKNNNRGEDFLGSDTKPTFVTFQRGKYVDGKKALWICILTAESIEKYYATQRGIGRGDAFR